MFSLAIGKITALLGRSGSGKTSLLRALAGLPSAFANLDRQFDITPLPVQTIAWMDQQDQLLPWLTARENMYLGARLRGEKVDKMRANALLDAVGLGGADSKKYPHELSGGMKQRVALARTLMENRAFILMDEPFSALDAFTRIEMQTLCVELFKGRTVFLVTHDPIEALCMAHHIYILDGQPMRLNGPLELEGEPLRAVTDPHVLQSHKILMANLGGQNNGQG